MKMDSDVPTNNNDMLVTLFFFVVNPFCQHFAYVPLLLKFRSLFSVTKTYFCQAQGHYQLLLFKKNCKELDFVDSELAF